MKLLKLFVFAGSVFILCLGAMYVGFWLSQKSLLPNLFHTEPGPVAREDIGPPDEEEYNKETAVSEEIDTSEHTTNTLSQFVVSPSNQTDISINTTAYGNAVITMDNQYRYISSNGIPEHETGNFPGPDNPNSISEQNHNYRVARFPLLSTSPTPVQISGVTLNGIPFEPGTAEFYNNDRNSGWVEEAFQDGIGGLGIDRSNAHVQPDGTYHYHASPTGLIEALVLEYPGQDVIHVGWAADGVPITYSLSNQYRSSYRIKNGTRSSGPGGTYDGTYTQDWEYVTGLGDLDECNGMVLGEQYVYLITDHFPFIGRCVMGNPDSSFNKGPGVVSGPPNGPTGQNGQPPQEAVTACDGKSNGSPCNIPSGPSGSCRIPPGQNTLACVPN